MASILKVPKESVARIDKVAESGGVDATYYVTLKNGKMDEQDLLAMITSDNPAFSALIHAGQWAYDAVKGGAQVESAVVRGGDRVGIMPESTYRMVSMEWSPSMNPVEYSIEVSLGNVFVGPRALKSVSERELQLVMYAVKLLYESGEITQSVVLGAGWMVHK